MKASRPHLSKEEQRYFGRNACIALLDARPEDVIRIYIHKDLEQDCDDILKWCAAEKIAFHIVHDQDLEKLTDSKHHQGMCVVAKEKQSLSLDDFLHATREEKRVSALFLDGIQNPHNLGAILRTAAHFGIKFVIGQKSSLPRLSPAANRTSEGGAESVDLVRVEDSVRGLRELKSKGFSIYSADIVPKAYSLYETRFAERCIFLFGNEVHGVSMALAEVADYVVRIPGNGRIESLNVSVAAALFMGEAYRQNSAPGTRRIVQK